MPNDAKLAIPEAAVMISTVASISTSVFPLIQDMHAVRECARWRTLDTLNLGLPLAMGKLSAETRMGDAFSRSIWRVTAVSIDLARASKPSADCCASANESAVSAKCRHCLIAQHLHWLLL